MKRLALVLALLALLLASACVKVEVDLGDLGAVDETPPVETTPIPTPTPTPTPTPVPTITPPGWPAATPTPTPMSGPIEIIDDLGRTVIIEETPRRVISLAPSIAESLFALGLGEKVVGVTEHCDYPPQALDKPKVGSYFSTSLEVIIALNPDIVFSDGHDPVCDQLERLVPLVVLQPQDILGIYHDISLVGRIMDRQAEAERLIDEMQSRIALIVSETAAVGKPTVFYEIDATDPQKPWTTGKGSFIDDLITLAGGRNMVEEEEAYLQISLEVLVDADPDIIILGDYPWVSPEAVKERPGWGGLSAVKNEKIYPIDVDLVSRPGPRIVDGLEEMAKIIHPELFP